MACKLTLQLTYGTCVEPTAQPRDKSELYLHLNKTISFIPTRYLSQGNWSRPVHKLYTVPAIDDLYLEAIELNEEIRCHFEARIQLFHQQLHLCHNSKLVLQEGPTIAQAGLKNTYSAGQLAEAHCSTLTNLQIKGIKPANLAQDSYFSNSWNATTTLPSFVNKIDSKIDFQMHFAHLEGQTFRQFCMTLLNMVSSGDSPDELLDLFLMGLIPILESLLKKYEESTAEREVVQCYRAIANHYYKLIQKPENISKLAFKDTSLHKTMWGTLLEQVSAYRKVDRFYRKAISIVGPRTQNKDLLIPALLLRIVPGKNDLEEVTQKIIAKKNLCLSETQAEYASRSLTDSKVVALAKTYFASFKSTAALKADLEKRDGEPFASQYKTELIRLLERRPKQIQNIFLIALPRLYASQYPTRQSLAVRRLTCMNDGWITSLTKDLTAIKRSIAKCIADPHVLELTNQLLDDIAPIEL